MKKLVDTNDPSWREARSEQWERYYGDGYRSRHSNKPPKWIVNKMVAHKAVYMGDASCLHDPVIAQDTGDPLCDSVNPSEWFTRGFFLSPHQCEENWLWMIEEGWRQWVSDSEWPRRELFVKLFHAIRYDSYDIIQDWGGDSDLFFRFFRFIAGSEYHPDKYTFNGELIGKHPLNPHELLQVFIRHVYCAIIGHSSFDELFVTEYDYAIKAFDYVNPKIFEPESKLEDRDEYELKNWFAKALHTIHRRESSFLDKRKRGRLVDYWKDKPIEDWRQSSEVNGLIRRLEDDMTNGRFPESVARLYHWAAAEAADTHKLDTYVSAPRFTCCP